MLNETINILNDLSLYGLKNSISNEIDYITNNKLSFLEGLNHFLKSEVKYRETNRAEANIKVAHFPYLKEIKDFDFDYQGELIPNIIGNNDFVGGLVGQTQQGTIINCYVKTYFKIPLYLP